MRIIEPKQKQQTKSIVVDLLFMVGLVIITSIILILIGDPR